MLKRKILLAEDDVDDQLFFQDFIRTRQDIILMPITEDGASLVDVLESISDASELPDLIILDQNMPKKNGLQTLAYLKSHERYAHIPVSIYSTYIDELLIKNGTELGACVVLSKPITAEGYHKMMEELFERCSNAG